MKQALLFLAISFASLTFANAQNNLFSGGQGNLTGGEAAEHWEQFTFEGGHWVKEIGNGGIGEIKLKDALKVVGEGNGMHAEPAPADAADKCFEGNVGPIGTNCYDFNPNACNYYVVIYNGSDYTIYAPQCAEPEGGAIKNN